MNIKQRHFIKSTEIKALRESVENQYGKEFTSNLFPKKCRIEWILTEDGDILYAINGKLVLWSSKEHGCIPVLSQLLDNNIDLKTVVVDKGAIKFITLSKADIMRPGITKIDPSIKRGDIVRIIDETHGKVLAIGKTMYGAEEMERMEKGKVIKNLHAIKDSIWTFSREFR